MIRGSRYLIESMVVLPAPYFIDEAFAAALLFLLPDTICHLLSFHYYNKFYRKSNLYFVKIKFPDSPKQIGENMEE